MNQKLGRKFLIHGALFVVTFLVATWIQSPIYAVSIMTILLAHELGHYYYCRKHRVDATFPIFIPMFNILGTLGAVIAMKSPVPNRKALFDIGVSGPLVGLAFAFPAIYLGLHFSEVRATPADGTGLFLGEPLIFQFLSYWVLGPIPENQDVYLHPIAFAGWAALFVTSINLFPIGQLDGGHVIYSMVGRKWARKISFGMVGVLTFLGAYYHPMWFIFVLLILLFILRHPSPIDDQTPLDRKRIWIGFATYFLMILCFSPVPFDLRLPPS